jgi:hypothetical protein
MGLKKLGRRRRRRRRREWFRGKNFGVLHGGHAGELAEQSIRCVEYAKCR